MYFDSIQAAWQMDGHGPYVWGAYLATLFVIALLIIPPVLRAKTARKQLLAEARRLSASSAVSDKHEAAPSQLTASSNDESTDASANSSTPKSEFNASET